MTWYVTPDYDTYEAARREFEWDFPENYNAAHDLLRKHDDVDAPALFQAYPDGRRETHTFRDLDRRSNRLANHLDGIGVEYGDRIAVALPQRPENPVTHFACWKLGAISVSLSILFGEEAMRYRLRNCGAKVAVVDESVAGTVGNVADECPELEAVIVVKGARGEGTAGEGRTAKRSFADAVANESRHRELAATDADTPAIILYTSGSTGSPKGVLHTHGLWAGTCTGFYMCFERDVFDSVYWSPADWAWIGALGNVVFPPWHYGQPIVGYPMEGFDATTTYELMAEFGVTDAFVPPTALRMMQDVENPADRYDLDLQVIMSGSEPVTPEILSWLEEALPGVKMNEIYGQTEANSFVTTCQKWFEQRLGKIGKAAVGHETAIVDSETAEELPPGEIGEIAIRHEDDPMVYREYWQNPEATREARVDGWHLTGDLGIADEDGYISFKSRDDDLIITSGYRVGPTEVERAILDHDAVEQVGVVGVPDEQRGEIIKAYVQPVSGIEGSPELAEELKQLVRDRYARYAYPREVEFMGELPTTTTGKIKRRALPVDGEPDEPDR